MVGVWVQALVPDWCSQPIEVSNQLGPRAGLVKHSGTYIIHSSGFRRHRQARRAASRWCMVYVCTDMSRIGGKTGARMDTWLHVCVYVHTLSLSIYIYMYIHTHTFLYTHVCTHFRKRMHACVIASQYFQGEGKLRSIQRVVLRPSRSQDVLPWTCKLAQDFVETLFEGFVQQFCMSEPFL